MADEVQWNQPIHWKLAGGVNFTATALSLFRAENLSSQLWWIINHGAVDGKLVVLPLVRVIEIGWKAFIKNHDTLNHVDIFPLTTERANGDWENGFNQGRNNYQLQRLLCDNDYRWKIMKNILITIHGGHRFLVDKNGNFYFHQSLILSIAFCAKSGTQLPHGWSIVYWSIVLMRSKHARFDCEQPSRKIHTFWLRFVPRIERLTDTSHFFYERCRSKHFVERGMLVGRSYLFHIQRLDEWWAWVRLNDSN